MLACLRLCFVPPQASDVSVFTAWFCSPTSDYCWRVYCFVLYPHKCLMMACFRLFFFVPCKRLMSVCLRPCFATPQMTFIAVFTALIALHLVVFTALFCPPASRLTSALFCPSSLCCVSPAQSPRISGLPLNSRVTPS